MKVRIESAGPEFDFCCAGARRAWDAEVLNLVPQPEPGPGPEGEPLVFTAALHYEGGSSLIIAYCPFCAAPVVPARERSTILA